MAKIRHIAYRAENVDEMAKFFVDAMGMKMIQKRKNNAILVGEAAYHWSDISANAHIQQIEHPRGSPTTPRSWRTASSSSSARPTRSSRVRSTGGPRST